MVEATISKWGNSEGIRIPKEIRDRIGLHEGSRVSIDVEGDRIIITPPRSHSTQVGRYNAEIVGYLPQDKPDAAIEMIMACLI
ncbi:Transcriptional regulator/antitoxin, MazE [Bifidobacterium hapali]|uniref:Transcriptional regulator/antitoxin, MazE n=1 Tax=Bifidobacterium hapali TaxID=1630172 RepID=A0A261G6Q3_9BIFI|nr:AbrB/MazE/SpoVT family DNA-binding domain-containing protein [Bifidobacterium hapali]OZG66686.1 Transcriptional regulator/antitoxin, MazE [Bifidobacterium hapali]